MVGAVNNRVGIGTSTPGNNLHVVAAPDTVGTTNGANFTILSPGLTVNQINSTTIGMGFGGLVNNFAGDSHLRSFWGVTIDKGSGNLGSGASNSVNADSRTFAIRQNAGGTTWNTQFCVNGSGNVGIGTTSPGEKLHVSGGKIKLIGAAGGGAGGGILSGEVAGELHIQSEDYTGATFADIVFDAGNGSGSYTERARIDSNGRLLVGTSTARTNFFGTATFGSQFLVEQAGSSAGSFIQSAFVRNSADTEAAHLVLGKTRGATVGSNTVVQSGDQLGVISFEGADGSDLIDAASIQCVVDGTPGADDMPGRLVFSVTGDGSASPTERMRIPSGGGLSVGSTVNPNALTQASGIRLGSSTIASHDFTNITTSPVVIANSVGIGGLAFVQAFNTSTGTQYTGLIMWRAGVVAVVSDSNALGFALTYSVSGSTLSLQTASGTISGSVITLGG